MEKRLREVSLGMLWAASFARRMLGAIALAFALGSIAQAAQPVLQRGYDAAVSGATLSETTLNTSNVGPNTFGLVFSLPVDDSVFAQPLYVPNVAIPNQGTHNVVYVATMSDTLYAFDADTGTALWSVNFASLVGATPVWIANFAFQNNMNLVGNLGILSTPVIDASTNIMYLIACTLENGTLAYRLHAVDITTGAEPYGPGVLVSGSYSGSTFDARYLTQRVSLALSGNQVVFAFGAVELEYAGGYVGWVMAYDKRTLQQSGAFATVTTGTRGGGVWQSGRPPVIDNSGYAYVFVGNGYTSGFDGVNDFAESVLKFDPANGLELVDWFTPYNWSDLDANDLDLSSSGPLLIPSANLLVGGGKNCELYVLDSNNLGGFNASDSQVVQKQLICPFSIRSGPVYWQRAGANGGPLLYNWGSKDWVKAYPFNGTTFAASPSSQGSGMQIYPGGSLALSANADQQGSGVLWATVATSGDALNNPPTPGELHAFDAGNVSRELWNSAMNPSRDGFGNYAKFVPPLIANGRVYIATWSSQVAVYGLLMTYTRAPTAAAFGSEQTNVASAPQLITVTNTGTEALPITSITLSGTNPNAFLQTNTCGSSVAFGSHCTISVVFKPTAIGPATALLNINGGGGSGAQTVALSGVGVVPPPTVSPTSVAFGNEPTNVVSAAKLIKVTNNGNVALPITSITLTGANPDQFSQTNTCGTSVAAAATCAISVTFMPTSIGSMVATLNINSGGGAGSQSVALSGAGVVSTYTVTPTSVVFASETVNSTSAAALITVKNTSAAALAVTSIALANTDASQFAQTNTCGISLAAGATCSISVQFKPTSTGAKSATLNINADGVLIVVPLSGTATSPAVTVSLSASPTSFTAGGSTTLTWKSTNATSCTGTGGGSNDNWSGAHPTTGSMAVTGSTALSAASMTLTYTLTCTSAQSHQSAQASAVVVEKQVPSMSSGGGGAFDLLSLTLLFGVLSVHQGRRKLIFRTAP